ncbi:hypothetical protein VNO77_00174 [Canavalia gladiata]|uniref:Uncharacterized protein n=1 Tax=Canavalia gladiata TaxID=3824 RepID=A0AAN9R910_CANGL
MALSEKVRSPWTFNICRGKLSRILKQRFANMRVCQAKKQNSPSRITKNLLNSSAHIVFVKNRYAVYDLRLDGLRKGLVAVTRNLLKPFLGDNGGAAYDPRLDGLRKELIVVTLKLLKPFSLHFRVSKIRRERKEKKQYL